MINEKHRFSGYSTFLVIFLGLIFGFGPFVTDMYLPAFPQLQAYFNTEVSMVQFTLAASMLGLAIGQVLWGPLSDRYGRTPMLKASLLLFLLSSAACVFAPSIELLAVGRLLQGVGGSGGIVLSRSIATDLYSGKDLAKMMAIIGAINGVAPVTAPVAGGLLTDSVGWRGIFVVLFLLGLALTSGSFFVRESLPKERRTETKLFDSFVAFGKLFKNRPYVYSILQYGFLHGVFFSYLAASPFIIQDHYGFSPTAYSIFFAVNAVSIIFASMLSMKFPSAWHCTLTSSAILLAACVGIFFVLNYDGSVWLFEVLTLVQVFCCGMSFASTPAMAMDLERNNAGVAAALLGVCTYVFGCIVTPLVGLGNTLVTTSIIFVVSAVFTLFSAYKAKVRA